MNEKQIKKVLENKHTTGSLLKKANVVSVGVGFKYVKGVKTKEQCVVVGVSKKEKPEALNITDAVPKSITEGKQVVNTDVIETGNIVAQLDPKQRIRPAKPGVSIGHYKITAGTFGCVVKRSGIPFILTNNHVGANSNDATKGDAWVQPGVHDGGNVAEDKIAELEDFVPIVFEGENPPPQPPPPDDGDNDGSGCPISRLFVNTVNKVLKVFNRKTRIQVTPQAVINEVDAAIGKPVDQISKEIVDIGKPTGIAEAQLGDAVQKYGRTTEYTVGEVIQKFATVNVDYGSGRVAKFENQIVTTGMSDGGDSGSVVLKGSKIVGLLFAGSTQVTIINPIQKVFEKLGVTL